MLWYQQRKININSLSTNIFIIIRIILKILHHRLLDLLLYLHHHCLCRDLMTIVEIVLTAVFWPIVMMIAEVTILVKPFMITVDPFKIRFAKIMEAASLPIPMMILVDLFKTVILAIIIVVPAFRPILTIKDHCPRLLHLRRCHLKDRLCCWLHLHYHQAWSINITFSKHLWYHQRCMLNQKDLRYVTRCFYFFKF